MRPRIAIIGGGISGLAAANRVRELDPAVDLILLESSNRLGGVLRTTLRDGFLIEGAADGFLTTVPWGVDFCCRLACELVQTDPSCQGALVVHRGRLRAIPPGFLVMAPKRLWPMLSSRILSPRGKLRLALEYFVPPRGSTRDESLASFVRYRFGKEVYDRLVQPLLGGIYAGDPEKLSLEATMPRFKEMERKYGSLLHAMRQKPIATVQGEPDATRCTHFVAPREGMTGLVAKAAERLPRSAIRLNAPVAAALPIAGGGWQLQVEGLVPQSVSVDGLILATPAFEAARILSRCLPAAASELGTIAYSSCAVVSLGYHREQIGHDLGALGFVVPQIEDRLILSCSFSSLKYPGRAPRGRVLLRVVVGSAMQAHLLRLSNTDLVELAKLELGELLTIRGGPVLEHVSRCPHAMPQYYVGHCERVRRVEQHLAPFSSLALAGSALYGIGIPNCIRSGKEAAEKVFSDVRRSSPLAAAV